MKTKIMVFLLFIGILGTIFLSCATTSDKSSSVEQINLAGTKWIWVMSNISFKTTIEFVDESNCIYTLLTGPQNYTYKIKGNKIYINKDTYELRGDIIYYKDRPHFIKIKDE
jgi:hypothetical protein